jgi:hypothetical protein
MLGSSGERIPVRAVVIQYLGEDIAYRFAGGSLRILQFALRQRRRKPKYQFRFRSSTFTGISSLYTE